MATIQNEVLIKKLRRLSKELADLAAECEESAVPEVQAEPCSYEEVRGVLAEKSRTGYRAEVKALIAKHGACQLSDINDPVVYGAIRAEAEGIGSG